MSGFEPFGRAGLEGRVALITGAAGGIGTAVARRFSELGVRLVLADRTAERLEALAASLPDADVLTWVGDLTSEPAAVDLVSTVLRRHERLEIAVNAAGVLRTTPLEEVSLAEWEEVFRANAGTAFLVCRECSAPMRRQKWGRIINFSSIAAQLGGILSGPHYAASKAAVSSLTRSVAKRLAPYGVRCNALAPSGVDTEMLAQYDAEQREFLRLGIPAGRFGTPQEIAELVAWLSSPAGDYITGQTIHINGGAYLG
jgi:3-oxoacyl-[acyl-carrier protein] reductase